jgi:hypothetical protein
MPDFGMLEYGKRRVRIFEERGSEPMIPARLTAIQAT